MKNVLITGHLGFIGKHLKPYLENKNYSVVGLDLKEGKDILTADLPNCDIVIHLAAMSGVRQSIKDPENYWRINVDGSRRLFEHYKNTRILAASSSSQYEPHLNPYAASKHIMECIPHSDVCFMRFHTVYGPNSRENMFFYKACNSTLEYVTRHSRDFIHIDDLCNAIDILLNSNYTGPIDVGTGVSIKIQDLFPNLPLHTTTPYERQSTQADITQLSSMGFNPKYKITDFFL